MQVAIIGVLLLLFAAAGLLLYRGSLARPAWLFLAAGLLLLCLANCLQARHDQYGQYGAGVNLGLGPLFYQVGLLVVVLGFFALVAWRHCRLRARSEAPGPYWKLILLIAGESIFGLILGLISLLGLMLAGLSSGIWPMDLL